MFEYFQRRYSPSNMALVATGNFDWDAFVARADQLCGAWTDYPVQRAVQPFSGKGTTKILKRSKLALAHAMLISEGPSAQDVERYPMAILATIMGDSSGSRMYWDLIHSGLAESASVDSDERDGTGCFSAFVSTTPEQLDTVVGRAKQILSTPLDFTDDDLDRAKAKVMSRIVLDGELPMGRLMALGLEWNYRRESTPLATVIERVRALSRSDIEAALARYRLSNWSEYRLVPE
jgi:predicted Zn-dependent peptidase